MKLTLVSVVFHGRTFSTFVMAPTVEGRTVVDRVIISHLLLKAGMDITEPGTTFSIS